jgi:hypothetical protein
MKTTNKEYAKSDRPVSGFYNVLLQRVYSKVDGIDVSKIDRVIEVVTISQLKELAVDVKKYQISNTQGLACRFENTRNYCFPVDAMSKLLDAADHAEFKKNYDRACKELEKQIAEEKKANDPVRKAVMQVVSDATVKTEEKQPDPVKKAISDVIPLNAAKTEKSEKAPDPVSEKKAEKKTESKVLPLSEKIIICGSPKNTKIVEKAINNHFGKEIVKVDPVATVEEKKEEKTPENKPIDPVVTKSVTIDSNYIENLIAAAPVAKKSKAKKSIKKSDLEQIAALF